MKLLNIRIGFATNSSSTHSIVVTDSNENVRSNELDSRYGYGWEEFILADKHTKLGYVATMLYSALPRGKECEIVKRETGQDLSNFEYPPYIDHQSLIKLPVHSNGEVHLGFFRALRDWLLSGNIAILGGNDNQESNMELLSIGTETSKLSFITDIFHGFFCRKETITIDGKVINGWSLFNRENGNRYILTFDDPMETPTRVCGKCDRPMLVDLCITHYCTKECPYCYMNATKEGKHASFDYIKSVIDALAKLEVWEVALGGGEPTSHPQFWEIVQYCADRGVTPNFSTKQLDWMKTMPNGAIDNIGAFAFSAETSGQVQSFYDACMKYDIPKDKMAIQFVLGTGWRVEDVAARTWVLGIPLTLLGQKKVGRGKKYFDNTYNSDQDKDWYKTLPEIRKTIDSMWGMRPGDLGVDTSIVIQYRKAIKDMAISPIHYGDKEGEVSCAIDAVNKTIATSSYDENTHPLPKAEACIIKDIFGTL